MAEAKEEGAETIDAIRRALRESEARYRALAKAISHVVWTIDADGLVTEMPQEWQNLTGQNQGQARGRGWLDALHPDDRERTGESWIEAITALRPYDAEYRIQTRDGRYRHFAARGVPVVDEDERIREWIVTCTDITERKWAEEALREINQKLQAIIRASPLAVVTLDTAGRVKTWNPAAERIYGWSALEVLDRQLPTVPKDKIDEFVANQKSGAHGNVFSGFETRRLRKDGSFVEVSISTAPLRDAAGEVSGIVALVTDITERKRAEAAIRESEQRAPIEYGQLIERLATLAEAVGTAHNLVTIFRALRDFSVASIPCIGIFISLYDSQQEVRTAVYAWGEGEEVDVSRLPPMPITGDGPNSRAVRTGRVIITDDYQARTPAHPSVLIGQDNNLLPNSSLALPMAVMGRIVGTIEVQSYEMAAYRHEHVTAMQMAANLAAVAIDNVRLFEHESRARAAAEESNRLKDEFLAILSHELRTPLTSVLGWTTLLRAGHLDEAASARALEVIERNARSQGQLIDDLLEVSRIITGKFRLDVGPVKIACVIEAAIDAIRPAAVTKEIHLESTLDAGASFVLGDPDRLQQVIWNLLSNAVKFTPQGGRIGLRLERAASHVRITVADTGQGVSAEFLPYIFDRFRQADSTTTRAHGGLGLGLAIVRHLVELHGGTVNAESDGVGQGTIFTIQLPLIAEAGKVGAQQQTNAAADDTESPEHALLGGVKVLVVDDEPDACAFLAQALRQHGAEVITAASTGEALAALESVWPDVLVSDIGMPGEDGYELIHRVQMLEKQQNRRLPAAALTAYASVDDRAKAMSEGFQTHVPKPIDPAVLVSVIANLAGRAAKSGETDHSS